MNFEKWEKYDDYNEIIFYDLRKDCKPKPKHKPFWYLGFHLIFQCRKVDRILVFKRYSIKNAKIIYEMYPDQWYYEWGIRTSHRRGILMAAMLFDVGGRKIFDFNSNSVIYKGNEAINLINNFHEAFDETNYASTMKGTRAPAFWGPKNHPLLV